jgi:hypothetical protein
LPLARLRALPSVRSTGLIFALLLAVFLITTV